MVKPESAGSVRRKRLERVSTPGDLDSTWERRFVNGTLGTALRTWREADSPSILLISVEGTDMPSRKLREYVWASPELSSVLSPGPATPADGVLAVRCLSGTADAAFLTRLLHLEQARLPLLMFLWGKSPIRVYQVDGMNPSAMLGVVAEMHSQRRHDWAELGWTSSAAEYPPQLPEIRSLHRRMAEGLLAALSAHSAEQLISRGFATAGDFVIEDVAVGLDADHLATELKSQFLSEEPERALLLAEQAAELAAAAAVDEQRAAEAERLREEEEAREIWRLLEREHRLEQLPPEPMEGDPAVLLTISLPGGRRVSRRFNENDTVRTVVDFAYGSSTDTELGCYPPSLARTFPRLRLDDVEATLRQAGIAHRTILYASELQLEPNEGC